MDQMKCLRCGKNFTRKHDLRRHLKNKKPCPTTHTHLSREMMLKEYDICTQIYNQVITQKALPNVCENDYLCFTNVCANAQKNASFVLPTENSNISKDINKKYPKSSNKVNTECLTKEYNEVGTINNSNEHKSVEKAATNILCERCGQTFKHRCNYYTHKKKYCNAVKEEKKLQEEFLEKQYTLLKMEHIENYQKLITENEQMKEEYSLIKEEYKLMEEQLQIITKKLENYVDNTQQNIVSNNNGTNNGQIANTGNINNIIINNYGNEDLSSINQDVFEEIAGSEYSMIQNMIDHIHVETPCNRNIYIPSTKEKYVMVLQDNNWEIRDKREIIDELIVNNHNLLTKLFDEYKNNLKTIGKERTRQVLEYCGYDAEERVKIKEHIMMNLLNKRYKIRSHYESVNKKRMNSR